MKSKLAGLFLLMGALAWSPVHASPYPEKPIRLIVGAAAGGGNDFVARAAAPKAAEILGQPIVIENKGGAAGAIASDLVARADPDGYTILLVFANFATYPSLNRKLNFDPQKDLVPISNIAASPLMLMVNPSSPAKSVTDLIALAKGDRMLDYASPGVGSMGHLAGELFQMMTHTKMQQVPYRGGGPAIIALLGGETDLFFSTPPAAMTQMAAGRLRALGVTGNERAPFAPEIPTITESGLPGYEVDGWVGLFAPKGTPEAAINAVQQAFAKAVRNEETQKALANGGFIGLGSSPAEFSKQLETDIAKWAEVIKTANITMN